VEVYKGVCADYCTNGKIVKKGHRISVEQGLSARIGHFKKENMVTSPILVFLDWEKTFHVHIDASTITLGEILAQP
jgi:hypothetical protein